ncbi:MAG: signal peptidase I [Melioribacteraceae bacterium]|nr:signal peptidase I [Melioribacteraceae bacterium]
MEQPKKEKNEIWEWARALILAFGLAFIIRYYLFTPIVVDGESMMPTLESGDRMVVNKIGYRIGELHRFDIVIFHATEEKDFVKRIIGLPGDHVAYKNDQLYINGEVLDEPYLDTKKAQLTSGTLTEDFTLEEYTQKSIIPEGYVFVMGDNRRNSLDSRRIGLVSVKEIIGDTHVVFWPMNEMGLVE